MRAKIFAILVGLFVGLVSVATPKIGQAQEKYPSRPIRFIVPFAAGGNTDLQARLVADELSKRINQPVIVENKAGGDTIIGASFVANSPPNGYTILVGNDTLSLFGLRQKKQLDVQKDLVAIRLMAYYPTMIFGRRDLPANNFREVIAYAKANPGMRYGTSGVGNTTQLSMDMLAKHLGIQVQLIPYKGGVESSAALMRGEVDLSIGAPFPAINYAKDGRLKVLGILGSKRSEALPEIPTVVDEGATGFKARFWIGFFAPKGTPPEIVSMLSQELGAVLNLPHVRQKALSSVVEPVRDGSPEDFAKIIAEDVAMWQNYLSANKIELE